MVVNLLRLGIAVGLLHIGGPEGGRDRAVQLDLGVDQIEHGALRALSEGCGVLDLGDGVVTLRLEHLVGAVGVHLELALFVELVQRQHLVVGVVPVDDRVHENSHAMGEILLLITQEAFLVLLHREADERLDIGHGALAEPAGGGAVSVTDNDAVADIGRILADAEALHGGMVHQVGVKAHVREDNWLVRQTVQHIRGGAEGAEYFLHREEAEALVDLIFRMLLNERLDPAYKFVNIEDLQQICLEELHRAADGAVAMTLGHAGDDQTALIVLYLSILTDVLLDALRVSYIDEVPAEDRHSLGSGLLLVHRVKITVYDPLGGLVLHIKLETGLVQLFGNIIHK